MKATMHPLLRSRSTNRFRGLSKVKASGWPSSGCAMWVPSAFVTLQGRGEYFRHFNNKVFLLCSLWRTLCFNVSPWSVAHKSAWSSQISSIHISWELAGNAKVVGPNPELNSASNPLNPFYETSRSFRSTVKSECYWAHCFLESHI